MIEELKRLNEALLKVIDLTNKIILNNYYGYEVDCINLWPDDKEVVVYSIEDEKYVKLIINDENEIKDLLLQEL